MAWEIFPWPCVGEFWFVTLGLAQHPFYPLLLERLQASSSPKLLDLGTCLGQDLRKLAFDGAPLDSLYGADICSGYETIGHELFRDQDRFQARFITGDLFDESSDSFLTKTKGGWDVISTVMFLHLWDLDDQVTACKRILKLLKPQKGSLIIGSQTGLMEAKNQLLKPPHAKLGEEKYVYRHSLDTFRSMWDQVQKDEAITLKVEVGRNDADAREKIWKEQERGERGGFLPPSDWNTELKLFFTVELM